MTNEQLVEEIKNGYCVNKNMEQLYKQNLPLIKKVCKPYAVYEPLEDLLQEAFIGLYKAIEKYDSSEEVSFITYALFWVKQSVKRYMEKCNDLHLPSYVLQMQYKYKRTVSELESALFRKPTIAEIADKMGVTISKVKSIRASLVDIVSINAPMSSDEDSTFADTLKADLDTEECVIDKIYHEQQKSELWGIVEHYTSDVENDVLRDYFIKNKSMSAIAREYNVSFHTVRTIKQNGLRKLKTGRAKRNLQERFEILEPKMYRSSVIRFKHDMESTVERIVCKRVELEEV